ncbi:hypothetical protein L6R53_12165 [Myxococcota bacterium]|nr:hypothetical protein [Myxococcota bacterium]
MPRRPAGAGLALVTLGLALVAQLPAWWGWLSDPAGRLLDNPFTGGHAWAADVVSDALWGAGAADPTDQAGFPGLRRARYVGWAFLGAAALLRPLWTPLAVVHLASLVGPSLGGAGLVLLARRVLPGGHPALQVAGGLLFALSPVTLGAALSGQVENTQTWLLPLLLLATWEATTRPRTWPLLPALWALAALTSPYLAMLAGLAAPWVAGLRWREGARPVPTLAPLALGAVGLALAGAWLELGTFDPEGTLYRPSFEGQGWPPLWVRPLPVAALDAVLTGQVQVQVKANVLHQPYLGLVLLAGALGLGGQRRRAAPLVLLGLLLAMGPRLAWGEGPVLLGGRELVLPAQALRWLDLPLAHGGQYYRAMVLAHLGLGLMLAAGAPTRAGLAPAGAALVCVLGPLDALRTVSAAGLPWPTVALPTGAWAALAADPVPGAILHLPMHSPQLRPNHPVRLAGRVLHRRAVSDLPRSWTEPPADPLLAQAWSASLATPRAALPSLDQLAAAGFRFVVVDLPAIPERQSLEARARQAWGPPTGRADGLSWYITSP